jgi:hypothetical protein
MATVHAAILFPVRYAGRCAARCRCRCDVIFPSQAALSTEL